ncbi:hypothetical protein PIB30_040707 [Stylosanthes scabra]|uniref:Uncharacterized protein n=1 Tax=Stylosanthes scabra TaxID=79078 RepID=A0ABU6SF22_9FABA|nr:hypothetical protein [Stylosanthes scabra]
MVNQDEEGVPYDDPFGDEQRQNPQPNPQQADLDLNATANGSQESAGRNAETDRAQNGQLNSSRDRSGSRRSTSAFDRLGPRNSEPRPFGGIGSDPNQIIQDLRHRMLHSPTERRPRSPPQRRRHRNSSESRDSSSDESHEGRRRRPRRYKRMRNRDGTDACKYRQVHRIVQVIPR